MNKSRFMKTSEAAKGNYRITLDLPGRVVSINEAADVIYKASKKKKRKEPELYDELGEYIGPAWLG